MKTIIERGASWTLEETKLLLALWGQDLVQRQQTNLKRTKEVYEKIAEKFTQNGFERTSDQVRTRVFNMIAEYRRILKDSNPERMKKCIFFDALHKIYQAKHFDDVKSALDDYEPECPFSPSSNPAAVPETRIEDTTNESDSDFGLVVDSEGGPTEVNKSKPVTTYSAKSNSNTNNNNNNNHTTTKDNSTINDLSIENNDNSTDSSNGVQNNSTSASITAGATLATATNDNDSNIKQFKIRTQNNEVMLLKVIEGESTPTNKRLKLEPIKVCSCENASEGKHNKTCPNHNNASTTSSSKQQSLLLPNTSTVAGSSTGTATTSTPITTKPGSGNNAYISINNAKIPIFRSNGLGDSSATNNLTSTPTRLQASTASVASHHQLYQAPVNTFDVTSSALLIDRMFAHLSRESENMREWIALEKERLANERAKRAQETEREIRRERILVETLMRFQEQWISFITRLDPKIIENAPEHPPELNLPLSSSTESAATSSQKTTTLQNSQSGSTETNDSPNATTQSGVLRNHLLTPTPSSKDKTDSESTSKATTSAASKQ